MSSKILIKRSTTTGAIPTTADLDTGEFAVNTVDKRIFTNNQGTIVELGTTPSTQAVEGNATVGGTFAVTGATTLSTGSTTGDFTVAGTLQLDTEGTASNHVVTKAYVDTAISDLVDGAGSALDTLKELADAINNDANFATTITNSIATKLTKSGDTMTGNLNMGSNKVTTTANPTADDDLTRKGYVDTILGSATAAATSASEAATSAANAATSESNASASATSASSSASSASSSATSASASATSASTSASSASTSASQASTSASNAATSATNAENAFDSFDDRYLGAKASDPTVDNDGDALIEGALYFNTTNDRMFVYTGSTWSAVSDVEALYNSGNLKLATTATGVDVTGTITADGLTVDGASQLNTTGLANGLTITGNDNNNVKVRFDNIGTGGGDFVIQGGIQGASNQGLSIRDLDNSAQRLYISSGGDVSFFEDTGTTAKMVWDASAESLNLGGTATTNTAGFSQNLALKDSYPSITFEDTGSGTAKYTIGATSGALGVWDSSVSAYRMFIDSSGNVGIGTISPTTRLHVQGSTQGQPLVIGTTSETSASDPGLQIREPNSTTVGAYIFLDSDDGNRLDLESKNGIAFNGANGAERMRLDSSGNLLVGKTSTDITGNGVVLGTGAQSFTSTNGQYSYRITTNGGVGLHHFYSDVGGTQTLKSYVRTDGNYVQLSDYRLKENITPIENAVDKVNKLKPVTYTWKNTEGKEAHGFIAHEFKEVLPNEVDGNKDQVKEDGTPFYQAINISAAIPLLVKAMQEQQEVIESLKTRIETLENN